MNPVRTRFAPSPTGYLHIGGVRTALFNWLFARKHQGQFLLRIDDTDVQRNVQEALGPILSGFRWLGIDWDEGPEVGGPYGPYYQSQRSDRYREAVEQLLDRGAAYWDYARPEEIEAERKAAQEAGRPFVYSRRYMAETDAERQKWESQGRQPVVRLRMPREGQVVVNDLVRGPVAFAWQQEQDHVIQRADGSVLYHLATVVDDADFRISHVIRAEEHLSNTPRQIFIAQALGFPIPQFAHLPQVAEPGSKVKLSKRKLDKYLKHTEFRALYDRGRRIAEQLGIAADSDVFNPVLVDFYRLTGFLPEAIVNYLLLLGWSLDDRTEYLDRQAMVDAFTLERVNKAPASFDPQKLLAFQAHYMQQLAPESKTEMLVRMLQQAGWLADPASDQDRQRVRRIADAAGQRIVVAGDILEYRELFVADDQLQYDARDFDKRLVKPKDAVALLTELRERLAHVDPFSAATTERCLNEFIEEKGIKVGQIIHALRVAVTGKGVGFGMFETLEILGRSATLARIDRALDGAAHGQPPPAASASRPPAPEVTG